MFLENQIFFEHMVLLIVFCIDNLLAILDRMPFSLFIARFHCSAQVLKCNSGLFFIFATLV